ncbi:MAG: hypothetical protein IPF47_23090 [Gemmatimonadetes bacterium]|nr:hypothetical protein [Gemmatimonadota bacterium]
MRTFDPPRFLGDQHPVVPFEQATGELRALMEAAVRERIPARGDVSVGLSGGRDSTAVYALARRQQGARVKSMSVTYPEGDPGREDDVILDVLRMCGGEEPHWISTTELPILGTVDGIGRVAHGRCPCVRRVPGGARACGADAPRDARDAQRQAAAISSFPATDVSR